MPAAKTQVGQVEPVAAPGSALPDAAPGKRPWPHYRSSCPTCRRLPQCRFAHASRALPRKARPLPQGWCFSRPRPHRRMRSSCFHCLSWIPNLSISDFSHPRTRVMGRALKLTRHRLKSKTLEVRRSCAAKYNTIQGSGACRLANRAISVLSRGPRRRKCRQVVQKAGRHSTCFHFRQGSAPLRCSQESHYFMSLTSPGRFAS